MKLQNLIVLKLNPHRRASHILCGKQSTHKAPLLQTKADGCLQANTVQLTGELLLREHHFHGKEPLRDKQW